ncbi:MAG: hypothetical protein J6P44_01310 [Bacteroidales bacterium]|nr:hypothetical protein [Bacteroidales bacterium]
MDKVQLKGILSQRIHAKDIKQLSKTADKEDIFALMFDKDKRTSDNAAWVMTHLPKSCNKWLDKKRDILIDGVLSTKESTQLRLFLNLSERLEYKEDNLRTDFLDFCLANCVSPLQPTGVQSLCMKLAYKQCILFDELLNELKSTMQIIHPNELSAGARSQYNKILRKINSRK